MKKKFCFFLSMFIILMTSCSGSNSETKDQFDVNRLSEADQQRLFVSAYETKGVVPVLVDSLGSTKSEIDANKRYLDIASLYNRVMKSAWNIQDDNIFSAKDSEIEPSPALGLSDLLVKEIQRADGLKFYAVYGYYPNRKESFGFCLPKAETDELIAHEDKFTQEGKNYSDKEKVFACALFFVQNAVMNAFSHSIEADYEGRDVYIVSYCELK